MSGVYNGVQNRIRKVFDFERHSRRRCWNVQSIWEYTNCLQFFWTHRTLEETVKFSWKYKRIATFQIISYIMTSVPYVRSWLSQFLRKLNSSILTRTVKIIWKIYFGRCRVWNLRIKAWFRSRNLFWNFFAWQLASAGDINIEIDLKYALKYALKSTWDLIELLARTE